MATVTICSDFGAPKNKVWHCFHIYFPWSDGTGCHELRFLNVSYKPTFSLSSFTFIKRLFSSSSISAIRKWCYLHIWGYWYFFQQSWFQLVLLPVLLANQLLKKNVKEGRKRRRKIWRKARSYYITYTNFAVLVFPLWLISSWLNNWPTEFMNI